MKTQVTCYYLENESPLKADRLMVGKDFWLEPDDYTIVSDDWSEDRGEGTLVVEVDIPATTCRFLGHSDGSPPACYGFGNPEAAGRPVYMEDAPDGFAPELVCLHCQIYCGEREDRLHGQPRRMDRRGVLEVLPELSADELGPCAEYISYIER